jgi:membrane protease YdiL (CAAX protease family)
MTTENTYALPNRREGVGRRWLAVVEVAVAFAAVHVCYRSMKHFTILGHWEGAAGTNFTPGMVMIAAAFALIRSRRKDLRTYGLTFDRWREHLSLGLACLVIEVVSGALGLALSGYEFDASRPPDPHATPNWSRLAVFGSALLGGLVAALAIVSSRRPLVRSLPAPISLALIAALAAVPPIVGAYLGRPFSWLAVLWLFFGAGFGEEIFYRGYIQSRVDEAWGRPWRLWGFEFGAGLLISSLLFGLVHALNTVDYFHGRFDINWLMGVSSIFVGLYFGLIRARTQSILPGAILHGLTDVLARLPNLLG